MLILSDTEENADKVVSASLDVLSGGGIIAFPTESYYALGVLATDESSVERLFEIKKRRADKPLPVVVGDMNVLAAIVKEVPNQAYDLINRFWPGALTLIFEANESIPALLTGGTGKVAVRIPGNSAALYLVKTLRVPITATSANLSSKQPADSPEMVKYYFGNKLDLLIDSGVTSGGKPSTIVDMTLDLPRIVRKGSVQLDAVL
jgi:L-threonylcarbamoyladenylate synthase